MSCTTNLRSDGFTLVELMAVITLIALVVAMSGRTMLDQIQGQRVADAVENARDMATAIEQVRLQLFDLAPTRFRAYPHSYSYDERLDDFLTDLNSGSVQSIRDQLPRFVTAPEPVLGLDAEDIYRVRLTRYSTFVTIRLGNEYAGFDFYSAARPSGSGVRWTVPPRILNPSMVEHRLLHEMNK